MADKKDEKPRYEKHYDDFKKQMNLINKTTNKIEAEHQAIMANSVLKTLSDGEGNVDYDLLKKVEYQTKLRENINKGYDTVLSDYYHTDLKSISKTKKEAMRAALMGANDASLKSLIESAREKFTLEAYKASIGNKHLERLENDLIPTAYAHMEAEDIPDLLKMAKLDDKFDAAQIKNLKDPTMKSAVGQLLYYNHKTKGKFKEDLYDNLGLRAYLKKD